MDISPNLVRKNVEVLRHIAASKPFDADAMDAAAMAQTLGRDASNMRKTLKALAEGGVIEDTGLAAHPWRLTEGGQRALNDAPPANAVRAEAPTSGLVGLRHDQIMPNPLNPRKDFDEGEIDLLRQSILQDGLLQNLVVRPAATLPGGEKLFHSIVAGESRWRAIGEAIGQGDWPEDRLIPCKIVDVDDARHTELALIENLRRRELKPLEEARAFQVLHEVHGISTDDLADRVSMTKRFIQQRLQLLTLDEQDQQLLDEGHISIEEARKRAAAPKPEPLVLSEGELLVMAELQHKWKHAPKRKGDYYLQTEIAAKVADPILARLRKLNFVRIETNEYTTERTYCVKSYNWPDPKSVQLPAIPEGVAIYRTAWLNGPFEIPAEGKRRLKQKAEQAAQTREANKRAKEAAARLAAAVEALAARPWPLSREDAETFAKLMKEANSGFPWTATNGGVSAGGKSYGVGINLYGVNPSLVRLLILAINAAGGVFPTAATVDEPS